VEIAMKALTDRQQQIIDWVAAFTNEHRMPPTVREIGRAFGISSAGVHDHLKALERKSCLRRGTLGARSLELTGMPTRESSADVVQLPLVGRIAAGMPVLAEENLSGTVAVERSMLGRGSARHFALRVKGDSMIEAGILDGDIVIMRQQETAENGEIVAALVDEDDGTLKRFYREKGRIRLQPENSSMKPIYSREVAIQGVVKALVRRFD
jgi:repressor LexA